MLRSSLCLSDTISQNILFAKIAGASMQLRHRLRPRQRLHHLLIQRLRHLCRLVNAVTLPHRLHCHTGALQLRFKGRNLRFGYRARFGLWVAIPCRPFIDYRSFPVRNPQAPDLPRFIIRNGSDRETFAAVIFPAPLLNPDF